MRAADLTDDWIGRTVGVHCCQPPHLGRLDKYMKILDLGGEVYGVLLIIDDVEMPEPFHPETVITDQDT